MPAAITRTVDAGWFRWIVRLVGLATFLYAMVSLLFGVDRLTNPIFGFIYILVWVGLVPISLRVRPGLADPEPAADPPPAALQGAAATAVEGLARAARLGSGSGPPPLGIFAFTWLELVAPDRATIPVLQAWLALYVVIMLFGAILFGDRWFSTGDPFEVYATLMARLSPWGRRTDGALVVRRPLENLDGLKPQPGLVGMVAALLGSTAYDGFSNSTAWIGWAQNTDYSMTLLGTCALIGFILFVLVTYSGATLLAGRLSRQLPRRRCRVVRALRRTDRPRVRRRALPDPAHPRRAADARST